MKKFPRRFSFPIPFTETLFIKGLPENKIVDIMLFEPSSGSIIYSEQRNTARNSIELKLNHLPDGVYLMELNLGNRLIQKKVIKKSDLIKPVGLEF